MKLRKTQIIISLLTVAVSLAAVNTVGPKRAQASTTTCWLYTQQAPQSTCDSAKLQSDRPCVYAQGTTDGGYQETICYDPTYYTCQPDGTCQLKPGAALPAACPTPLQTNQPKCHDTTSVAPSPGVTSTSSSTPQTGCDPGATGGAKPGQICIPQSASDCNISDENGSCALFRYINLGINVLSVMIGIVVTILIIVGGIQYTMAGPDPNKVAKAKARIGKAIGTLIAYGLLYAVLQYLVPGGIFQ